MSVHAILSPSSAERWLNCTPAPRLEAAQADTTSEYAAEGTLAHSICELMARKKFTIMKQSAYNKDLKALKAEPLFKDEMLNTAQTYVEHLTENSMKFENAPYVAFEVKIDLSGYVPDAFGTCDCVMIGGNELIITDYKHGTGVPVEAKNNPQIMLYALGALKVYKPIYGDAINQITCHIDQPRLNSYSTFTMTVEELLDWGEKIVKPKAKLAYAGVGDFNPGSWCKFCKVKAQCRARTNQFTALEEFKDVALPGTQTTEPLLSYADIGNILTRAEALVDWYNSIKDFALKACLDGAVIPGWKLVVGRATREWTDADKAIEEIIKAGYAKEIVYETKPKTLAQLEKVIGKADFTKLVGKYVSTPPGKPSLAVESDKRPAYKKAAVDFAGVVEQTIKDLNPSADDLDILGDLNDLDDLQDFDPLDDDKLPF